MKMGYIYKNLTLLVILTLIISNYLIIINSNEIFVITDSRSKIRNLQSPSDMNYFEQRNLISSTDIINIKLNSPQNNSIVNGGTVIDLEFVDENGSLVIPVTELYRWDFGSNFESILRPLPFADGSHTLEIEVESEGGTWNFSKFVFISDNEPHNIDLISPENCTHDIQLPSWVKKWETEYPSGTLKTIELADVSRNGLLDILVGGSAAKMYAFAGDTGQPIYQTSQFTAEINDIEIYNNSFALIGLNDGVLRSINVSTGFLKWSNSSISTKVVSIIDDPVNEQLIVLHEYYLRSFNYSGYENWFHSFGIGNSQKFMTLNGSSSVISINSSAFVSIIDINTGDSIINYSTSGPIQQFLFDGSSLFISTTDGYVRSYNYSSGMLNWETQIAFAQNVYSLTINEMGVFCTTGNGHLILVNKDTGSVIWDFLASTINVQHSELFDFDGDTVDEVVLLDGGGYVRNYNSISRKSNWNYSTTGLHIEGSAFGDFDNDTFNDLAIISTEGTLVVIDPREKIPHLVPSWANVTLEFSDDISGNMTFWEKYSWDGGNNQSSIGSIPETSGIHTLDVWVSDNASNIAHAFYQFYSVIEAKLNFPLNGSRQQSGTFINFTFSESPIEEQYKWDSEAYQSVLSTLPTGESTHKLYVKLKDQSYNTRTFYYEFITDDTAIQNILLVSHENDSIVEGGENITIEYTEIPYITLYSWDGLNNETSVFSIPVSSDTHILEVFAADYALNWKTTRFVFHTKIKINLYSHLNNTVILPNSVIQVAFGEAPDVYMYQINSDPCKIFSDHNQTLNLTLPTVSKTYSITIKVNDSLNGRWNNETYIFVVMIYVNISSHQNNSYAETGDVLDVYLSDIPITKLFSWDGKKNSSRTPVVPEPDGPHYLDIYVGNIEGQFWHYHYDFIVDTDLIDILLVSPTNNTRVNSWINISIEFSETPDIANYIWDNGSLHFNLIGFPQVDGGHILNITVFDVAGNKNSRQFYWIIDDTPINITLQNGENNSIIYTGDILNVSFSNEIPLIEWYKWDNGGDSPVLPPTPSGNGTHTLNITAYDGLNWNTKLFVFNVTDLPPDIVIERENLPYRSGSSILMNFSDDVIDVWHQWDETNQIDGSNVIVPPLADGEHILTIFCKDTGDSASLKHFTILIDNTPVKILEASPKNGSRISFTTNISIAFDEEPYSVTYSWDGDTSMTFNITNVPNTEGTHILYIVAYDLAGNKLAAQLIYKIPTELELLTPYIYSGGFIILLVGVVGFLQRKRLSKFYNVLKEKLTPPQRE